MDRLGESLKYTTRPKERSKGTTRLQDLSKINTRTSPQGLGDAKFTLIHWRNCLEELIPEEKESTSLEDRLDPAAGEAPVSKRRSRRRRWRERGGRGWKNCQNGQFTPMPPFYMDKPQDRIIWPKLGPDIPAPG
jgi:hypothetical protein